MSLLTGDFTWATGFQTESSLSNEHTIINFAASDVAVLLDVAGHLQLNLLQVATNTRELAFPLTFEQTSAGEHGQESHAMSEAEILDR